ncbi:MAG TPA: hypothetical protein VHW23_00895 [Kofleriaceae bacterium]|jgi:hypothetical protein|nr:hypothetical protein [Kofleriaceae bacterium]
MRKAVLLVAAVVISVCAWRWKHADDTALAPSRLVADRIWIDHIPRNERDTVQVFFANGKDALGLFAASSQWRGRHELFRYEGSGAELRVVYPQTGERETVRATARRCDENGMDFCLEVQGASRGVKQYYSRKGWEVDPNHGARAAETDIEALRDRLLSGT